MAENAKNDLDGISRVKQEELKQVLKQLEKEKITVVELRHQILEKDKNFSKVVEELQASSQTVSEKYDEAHSKLGKAESDMKIKNIEVEQMKRELERKEKELTSQKKEFDDYREKHELLEYRLNNKL
jgi:chromosome segregation ATPase